MSPLRLSGSLNNLRELTGSDSMPEVGEPYALVCTRSDIVGGRYDLEFKALPLRELIREVLADGDAEGRQVVTDVVQAAVADAATFEFKRPRGRPRKDAGAGGLPAELL